MATIIQPYNDWREQAAIGIIGPLITGLLNRHWQNEENRKNNALTAKTLADAQKIANQRQPGGLLQSQPEPEGYNSDGWSNAFHQATNPVAQYNLGTTGLVPLASLQVTPSIQDIQDALIRNMGTRRFGMVNGQAAMANLTPYLQALEQGRQEQMRKDLAGAYAQAKDAGARRDVLTGGLLSGIIPESLGAQMQKQYEYDNPYSQAYSHNTGATTQYGAYNPLTGEFTQRGEYANGLTPAQIAENDYRARQAALQNNQFWATLDEQRRQNDRVYGLQKDQQDMTREQMNRPKYGQPFAGSDGKMYQMDEYGNTRPFMVGGEHMDAPREPIKSEWTKGDDAYVENIRAEIKALEEKLQNKKDYKPIFPEDEKGTEQRTQYEKEVAAMQAEIQQKREHLSAYITGKTGYGVSKGDNGSGGSLGSMMIGNVNAGNVSRHGEFGNNRGDHYHKGTDFPAPAGTPITIMPEMGANLKVVHVNTNPSASTYGNNVLLEGSVGGHKVQYRMAHMQTGSIKVKVGDIVKPGDVVGGVGSTGHSTGNHLHLEVIVDGQHIDPEKFLRSYVASSPSVVSTQPPQPTPTTSGGQIEKTKEPLVWATADGKTGLTQSSLDKLLGEVRAGKHPNIKTEEDLYREFELQGLRRVTPNVNTSSDGSQSIASVMKNDALDWRPSYQKTSMSPALTAPTPNHTPFTALGVKSSSNEPSTESAAIFNHATNADIYAGLDRLNGEDTTQPPQSYFARDGVKRPAWLFV